MGGIRPRPEMPERGGTRGADAPDRQRTRCTRRCRWRPAGVRSTTRTPSDAVQHQADLYAIGEIEKNFHQAMSQKDIDLMMSLWAPNATFTAGPGKTVHREGADPDSSGSRSTPFKPETSGSRRPPRTRSAITVNGDRGTLYFECHFVDADAPRGRSRPRTAGRQDRRGMDDHQHRGGVRHADPLRWGRLRQRAADAPVAEKRRPLSPGDNLSSGRSAACPSGSTRSC